MKRLRLLSAQSSHPKFKNYPLPQPFASISLRGNATGDDCSIATSRYLGVADGVGQWNRREHGSAGLWSRLMITSFAEKMDAVTGSPDGSAGSYQGVTGSKIVDILEESYHDIMAMCKHPKARPTGPSPKGDFTTTSMSDPLNKHEKHLREDGVEIEYQGSTTLLVGALQADPEGPGTKLHIVNIGDSGLLLIRDGTVSFATEEQQHWFDCPFQIGHNSPDTPATSGVLSTVDLRAGDLVVASTDGLGDNVYPSQILEVIEAEERQATEANQDEFGTDDLGRICKKLCAMAREKMADEWGESPFGDKAICEGIGFMGGKKDDVSIVVSRVVEDVQSD
ncbi:protein of unknown function [Taphrina deformans PYCC 5710]|uniref:Protein phosphatase n=1 Tax=Taphrina deformans (strain PYCC 5710 / ATCC 11124 / CBS 356.35 / IMI 108563 / JCM 9778 / NBRC 8474) TaxID=1097556 RepID=R4XEL3_TAPDE|nr:protein of unknown function [Taphrina deformans PYCC 5710]|eukprot:CCG84211.1 protein of unknown function [Taphrina deformans PYCC 5710]